ncbi:MAG: isoprenylcysteine carboxylmethyltransferase family protein [Thaumarchaeota archaeon]|nr:isoprenylcysteine carboxylmethyltransferase family protein [Nitrososphaerota archaeon]MCL5317673.1 isoprenylcysteine carboxylmethyltransferase family protein [Nitrososphaerota archaeon]
MSVDRRKLSFREDWPTIPYVILILVGIAVSAYDLVVLQGLRIRSYPVTLGGVAMLMLGGSIREISRITLRRAGFGLVNSARLRVMEKQKLVTTGIYLRIRHPLYLGEIIRNTGFAFAACSLYGLIPVLIGNALLLFRIGIEERMLLEEFGVEYEEYMRRTKKLVPHIY